MLWGVRACSSTGSQALAHRRYKALAIKAYAGTNVPVLLFDERENFYLHTSTTNVVLPLG